MIDKAKVRKFIAIITLPILLIGMTLEVVGILMVFTGEWLTKKWGAL